MYQYAHERLTDTQRSNFKRTFLIDPDKQFTNYQTPVGELHAIRSNLRKLTRGLLDTADKEKRGLTSIENDAIDSGLAFLEDCTRAFDMKEERASVTNAINEVSGLTSARSLETWEDTNGKKVSVLAPEHRYAEHLARDSEQCQITPGQFLRAMVLGAKNEEVRAALSEGTDSAGGYTVPTFVEGQIIDLLRAQSHCISAGCRTVPLMSEKTVIAKIASDPVASWRSENGVINESGPSFSSLTFTARSLAVLVLVSRELLEDSVNIENALQMTLTSAMAQEVDRVCLFGSGVAPEPLGLYGTSGVNAVSMAVNGASITNYSNFLAAARAMAENNSRPPTAAIMAPRTRFAFSGLTDTLGQPLNKPDVLANLQMLQTTKVPVNQVEGTSGPVCSSIILGDFTQMYMGMRSGMRIEVLKERFADNLQYGFLCHLRMDVQISQPKAFAVLKGIKA